MTSRWIAGLLVAFSFALAGAEAQPASLDGDWEGVVTLPNGQSLRAGFHFETVDKVQKGQMLSPDQGATFPVSGITRNGTHVTVSVSAVMGQYDATLSADGRTLEGTWQQGPGLLPLTLTRRAPVK